MVNEIALVLLYSLFGWKIAAIYAGTGLAIAMISGWVIGRLGMESHVEEWVYAVPGGGDEGADSPDVSWRDRIRSGLDSVRDIVGKVWPYVVAGIAVGAAIHGYVPENFMAGIMGAGAWWSVPLAVLLGIPMYSNAAGIIPVVQALLGKGAALGTVLAFMMSVIGLSLPEMIILRKVLKVRLIATFAGVVGVGILIVGYLFNSFCEIEHGKEGLQRPVPVHREFRQEHPRRVDPEPLWGGAIPGVQRREPSERRGPPPGDQPAEIRRHVRGRVAQQELGRVLPARGP